MAEHDAAGEAAYEKTIKDPTPLDPAVAAERLKLVKRIFDEQGVHFWIGSGTLLGAVREGRFIPWDDEMDTAGVIGMHGLDMDTIYRVGEAFRSNGFYPRIRPNVRHVSVALVKDGIRTDWTCHKIVNGRAYEFPGVELPLHLFETLGEIEFIGERFRTPNPPEEYLRRKYGPDWRTPKGPGFESDVVGEVAEDALLDRGPRLLRRLSRGLLPRPNVSVQVFDRDGESVPGAELDVAGLGRARADARGIARLYVPGFACYALTVTYPGHRELLYEEFLDPGADYTYRPGPIVTAEQHYKAGVRAMALIRENAKRN